MTWNANEMKTFLALNRPPIFKGTINIC